MGAMHKSWSNNDKSYISMALYKDGKEVGHNIFDSQLTTVLCTR